LPSVRLSVCLSVCLDTIPLGLFRERHSKLTGSLSLSRVTLGQKFKSQGHKTDRMRNMPEIKMAGRTVLSLGCGYVAPKATTYLRWRLIYSFLSAVTSWADNSKRKIIQSSFFVKIFLMIIVTNVAIILKHKMSRLQSHIMLR